MRILESLRQLVRNLLLRTPRQAERDAQDLLNRTWMEGDTLAIPIDPIVIAERLGIDVVEKNLPPKTSAAIEKRPGQDPVIYLHRYDSDNRKRFSCAHELGHFVHRRGDEDYGYVDNRALLATTGTDAAERYANRFAAALLMPDWAVRKLCTGNATTAGLASEFGVSAEAMSYRLQTLGLTTRW